MVTIRVVGSSSVVTSEQGKTLLQSLQAAGMPISTSCGARAACGLCRVTVTKGAHLLSPLNAQEIGHLGTVAKVVALRLACQSVIIGDGEIELEVPAPVDVASRKRDKARRSGPRPRAGRGGSAHDDPGRSKRGAEGQAAGSGSTVRIEWRPRKFSSGGGGVAGSDE